MRTILLLDVLAFCLTCDSCHCCSIAALSSAVRAENGIVESSNSKLSIFRCCSNQMSHKFELTGKFDVACSLNVLNVFFKNFFYFFFYYLKNVLF